MGTSLYWDDGVTKDGGAAAGNAIADGTLVTSDQKRGCTRRSESRRYAVLKRLVIRRIMTSVHPLTIRAVFLLLWIVLGIIGGMIGKEKGRSGDGFCLGIVLGPIGLIIIALMRPVGEKECPHCRSKIHGEATVCPHCQREQPAPVKAVDLTEEERLKQRGGGVRFF
jgi:hypothetical protein